jgi:hypothetical protein
MTVQNILSRTEWRLSDQCAYLWEQHGIAMSKQSLDERYSTFTVAFLKRCCQRMENHQADKKILLHPQSCHPGKAMSHRRDLIEEAVRTCRKEKKDKGQMQVIPM